ncbi:hypothetical protein [Armatimonas sp.]|uniref:hypothetical protein n=1 Tax=Armatimonas sp. TaxID=1872638 RepID=UPI00375178C0
MKQSIPVGAIIGAVVALIAIVGFIAYRMFAPESNAGPASAKTSAGYMQRNSSSYGQTPAGKTKPTDNMGGRPQQGGYGRGYGGSQPGGQGGYGSGYSGNQGQGR